MTPLAKKILEHMLSQGSISAREALLDLDVTSASLTRRITEISKEYVVVRERKTNPATGKRYTRYSVDLAKTRQLMEALAA